MTIRAFTDADAPTAAKIIVKNNVHLGDVYTAKSLIEASSYNTYWVAEIDSQVVGIIGLSDLQNGIGMLATLAVHPAHQGKGIGKTLLKHAKKHAAERQFRKLLLLTHEKNKPMMILAIKEDFVPEGSLRNHFRDGQKDVIYFSYFVKSRV